jgi:hypothetical protein
MSSPAFRAESRGATESTLRVINSAALIAILPQARRTLGPTGFREPKRAYAVSGDSRSMTFLSARRHFRRSRASGHLPLAISLAIR